MSNRRCRYAQWVCEKQGPCWLNPSHSSSNSDESVWNSDEHDLFECLVGTGHYYPTVTSLFCSLLVPVVHTPSCDSELLAIVAAVSLLETTQIESNNPNQDLLHSELSGAPRHEDALTMGGINSGIQLAFAQYSLSIVAGNSIRAKCERCNTSPRTTPSSAQ